MLAIARSAMATGLLVSLLPYGQGACDQIPDYTLRLFVPANTATNQWAYKGEMCMNPRNTNQHYLGPETTRGK